MHPTGSGNKSYQIWSHCLYLYSPVPFKTSENKTTIDSDKISEEIVASFKTARDFFILR